MRFGLNEDDFAFLHRNLIQPLRLKGLKVYIFGSRASGKNHPFSDVDILVEGDFDDDVDSEIFRIKEQFEESNFPIKIDLVKSSDLAKSYQESVMSERVEIY